MSEEKLQLERLQSGIWRWPLHPENGGFSFSCSACGECCRGEMDIFLNLLDLQKMIRFLGFSNTEELFRSGYVREVELEEGGFRPAIQFQGNQVKCCPFLENRLDEKNSLLGLCRLHPDFKPLVCALAPLGRELNFDDDMEFEENWFFTEPVAGCPGCRVQHMEYSKEWIQHHRQSLVLERKYFEVMELLQRSDATVDRYREFHYALAKDQDIGRYLISWRESLG